ncbi:MAG: hypothetical protein P1P87_05840 [Trueperaceae bacterium]|nr:hypothetical protein [Trueperaceae bacterium]
MRTPLTPFFAAEVPSGPVAGAALRFAYGSVFLAQTLLALVIGTALAAALPTSPRPNDAIAAVLLAFGVVHLPLGVVLAWAASRAPGKGTALGGAIAAAVALSVPAWFLALAVLSAQRSPFLFAGAGVLAVGYALGFALVPRFVRAACAPVVRGEDAVADQGSSAAS